MADGSKDPVAERKRTNQLHVDLCTFHFVDQENFELLGGPFGKADEHKDGVALGPTRLKTSDFLPIASVELQEAQKAKLSDRPLMVRRWVADHRVQERWLYAYAIEAGGKPVFHYEIHADAKGRIAFLDRDKYLAARPDGDTEDDKTYLARPEWTKTLQTFFQQRLPVGKSNQPVKWHFFGSPLRLLQAGVTELESDDKFFSPDPGYNHFAQDLDEVEGVEMWKLGRLVPVEDGVVIRVFDPLVIVDNMRKEFASRLDAFLRYSAPVGDGNRLDKTQRRLRVAMIANHVEMLIRRSNNVELGHDEVKLASELWESFLKEECFTEEEIALIRTSPGDPDPEKVNLVPLSARSSDHFLVMEKRIRESYLNRINKAATRLLLWLTSEPWFFAERQYFTRDEITNEHGHRFLRVCTESMERLGETDIGRNYLQRMLIEFEDKPGSKDTPNQFTVQQFVLRDEKPTPTLDTAKVVLKAGKAPFDLWSKFVSLLTAMNKDYLTKLFETHKGSLTKEQLDQVLGIVDQKQVFAASALFMTNRIERIYGVKLVRAMLFTPEDFDTVIFFAKDGSGTAVDRSYFIRLDTPETAKADLADLEATIFGGKPKPKLPLTFEHVSTVTGFLGLFLNIRELYVSATEKGAVDTAKAAFGVFTSVYGLPFVSKAVQKKITNASLPSLSESMAQWVTKRGVATIGFVIQGVTVAMAVADTWGKASHGQTEEIISSSLNLTAQTLLLISAGMVVASGGTLTPAAAVLTAAAAVIAVGQFIYDLFKPGEEAFGLRLCLFGKGFEEGTGSAIESARPWQACLGNDLRQFNPKFTKPATRAYDTQLSAFSNLIHNYHVQIDFSDKLVDTGADITILPGALPRDAFFEVTMTVGWWLDRDTPSDHFEAEVSFRFHPFAKGAPPLPELRRSTEEYTKMRKAGIIDPQGAPMSIFPTLADDKIGVRFGFAEGAGPTRWTGKIESVLAGAPKPSTLRFRHDAKWKAKSEIKGSGEDAVLEITIDFDGATAPELITDEVGVLVQYRRFLETSQVGVEIVPVVPELLRSTNAAGRERLKMTIPNKAQDGGFHFGFDGFKLQIRYRNTNTSSTTVMGTQTPGIVAGGSTPPILETFEYDTDELMLYELEYHAELVHAGGVANVTVSIISASVRVPGQATRQATGLLLPMLVMQYIRNEGVGAPFEEGSRGNEIFQTFKRDDDNVRRFTLRNNAPDNGGPIELFDVITVRLTAKLIFPGSTKGDFTSGPYQENLKVDWSWADPMHAVLFEDAVLIKSVKAKMRLVLDPDLSKKHFLPNDVSSFDREAFLELEVEGSGFDMAWIAPKHRYSALPGVGLPSSGLKAAIDACKTDAD